MRPIAIRVNSDEPIDKLQARSRIDFGKVFTIQHNVKVKSFGQVHPDSMAALQSQFLSVWHGDASAGAAARSPDTLATLGAVGVTVAGLALAGSGSSSRRESGTSLPGASSSSVQTSASSVTSEGARSAISAAREAQAKAAVQRLMQAGRTQDEAIDMVRAKARQQVQEGGGAASSTWGDEEENESSTSDESDDDFQTQREARSTSQQRQHPPRVDSRSREQAPPRRVGASIPKSTMVPARTSSQNISQLSATAALWPATQELSRSPDSMQVSKAPHPAQQSQHTRQQAEAAVQRLIARGHTRVQALEIVAASPALQSSQQQQTSAAGKVATASSPSISIRTASAPEPARTSKAGEVSAQAAFARAPTTRTSQGQDPGSRTVSDQSKVTSRSLKAPAAGTTTTQAKERGKEPASKGDGKERASQFTSNESKAVQYQDIKWTDRGTTRYTIVDPVSGHRCGLETGPSDVITSQDLQDQDIFASLLIWYTSSGPGIPDAFGTSNFQSPGNNTGGGSTSQGTGGNAGDGGPPQGSGSSNSTNALGGSSGAGASSAGATAGTPATSSEAAARGKFYHLETARWKDNNCLRPHQS